MVSATTHTWLQQSTAARSITALCHARSLSVHFRVIQKHFALTFEFLDHTRSPAVLPHTLRVGFIIRKCLCRCFHRLATEMHALSISGSSGSKFRDSARYGDYLSLGMRFPTAATRVDMLDMHSRHSMEFKLFSRIVPVHRRQRGCDLVGGHRRSE